VHIGSNGSETTALDYAETNPVDTLVSVAGFGRDYGSELNTEFMQQRTIDFSGVRNNVKRAAVFYGDNDPYVTPDALADLAKELRVTPVVITNGGHLNSEAGYTTFPELLKKIAGFLEPVGGNGSRS
jgi:predicted alpha/beta hydrolase family esterase